ncbi:MAG: hypothetical protein HYZ15_11040 [Sphingobacteriales bacterium]|nr:hypothetical protein [Sphingobacteriales bacterium]
MKQNRIFFTFTFLAALSVCWLSCNKPGSSENPPGPYKLSYGDSIIYLKPVAGDYVVYPVTPRTGTYSGFPDGIEIDELTGAINVSKSETGLRYRITHISPEGDTTRTLVVLSGITFRDHFYVLSSGDSVAHPVYNANEDRFLPITGSLFDEGNLANTGGCAVRTENGKINLAESIRNGVFGANPQNDDKKEFEIKYRINDASGKSQNKLKVLLYWYNSMADIPQYLWDILNDRTTQGVFLRNNQSDPTLTGRLVQLAKPRPPCVVIVAH